MKSLRVILFALVVPAAAACGGSHDSKSTSDGDGSSVALPTLKKSEPDPVTPIAVEDKGPQTEVKAEAPVEIPAKFSDALALGKALSAKGDHSRAKEVLEAAAKMDRKSAEPHIELARMYIAMGERGLAIKSANKAVKLAPTSSQAHNTLGRAELARYNYDNAIAAFRQATELNPDNTWAWNNLGFAHLQLKQYSDAIEALKIAVEKKDATGYMFNNLGTAYEQLDQLDEAREAFEGGAKLGSVEAKQSRKRLEGVDSIAMFQKKAEAKVEEKTYENAEPMPEDIEDPEPMVEDRQPDVKVEEPAKVEAPKAEEPAKAEAPAPVAPATT